MLSWVISYGGSARKARKMSFYDMEYDIITKLWYHIWYHEFGYDINSARKAKRMISYMIYKYWYHIWYQVWYCIWYQVWYHIQYHRNGIISSLLMSSKELSNFIWNCGKNPAKTIYFAGPKNNVFCCCRDSNPALHTVRLCRLPLNHWPTVWDKMEWMRLYTTSNNSIKSR